MSSVPTGGEIFSAAAETGDINIVLVALVVIVSVAIIFGMITVVGSSQRAASGVSEQAMELARQIVTDRNSPVMRKQASLELYVTEKLRECEEREERLLEQMDRDLKRIGQLEAEVVRLKQVS